MKTVATAMGNPTLNQELKRYADIDTIGEDLFYQEAVIDFLEKEKVEVLTISGILQGQWDLMEFVQKIQAVHPLIRMIVIMDEMDTEIKCKLLEKGVKDIFLDDTVEVKDIVEAIMREEPLREKLENQKKQRKESMVSNEPKAISLVQKQEVIAISGINGSGKSTITAQLSKELAKKTESKILVMDLNTLCGNLEERYGINKVPQNVEILLDDDKKCGLNYAADLIKKERFDANVLEEIVTSKDGVDILTGNTSLYYCQEVLNSNIYQTILQCAKEKYDFIFIDTSSNLFLDATKWSVQNASKVLFVLENDYLCLKKAEQMLQVMTKNWGVWKNKIELIINKERAGAVSFEVVEKIMEEYRLVGRIKQNKEKESLSYEKILERIRFVPKTNLFAKAVGAWQHCKEDISRDMPKNFFAIRSGKSHVN